MQSQRLYAPILRRNLLAVLILAFAALASAVLSRAQTPAPPAPTPAGQQPDQATPDSGGPSGDNGVIALPKKKDKTEDVAPALAAPKIKNPEGMPNFSLRVEVPEVTVDVGVLLEKTGQFYPGLKPSNFHVYEDGKLQTVIGFKRTETPITALLVCEFAATNYSYINDMRNAAFAFTQQLRPNDSVGMMTFDMNTQIVSDFTQDKRQLIEAINTLRIPSFRDTNVFDAIYEAEDRLSRVEGRKYIILIASGRDTFSKITLDKVLQKIKNTPDVTIFAISTGGFFRAMTEGRNGSMRSSMRELDNVQADNQMKTFAHDTGGMWFAPRFTGELPDIFQQINQNIRSKYQLVYHPNNAKQDGTYRKLRVELVDDEGHPLQLQDEKHKPLKYDIIARDGYRAKPEVE